MPAVRLLRDAVIRPSRCAFIPYIGSTREPVGFFDFGTDLFGEHVYGSYTAFLEMAKIAGYVPAARAVDGEKAALKAELAATLDKLAEAEKQLEAIETLKRAGFASAKRPGRPKKEPVPA